MDSLTNQAATQLIYYWLDGYWIKDQEEAELMDSINAFGSEHRVIELPLEVNVDEQIKLLVADVTKNPKTLSILNQP